MLSPNLATTLKIVRTELREDVFGKARPKPDLSHLPGDDGLPWLGHAIDFLTDARGLSARMTAKYGDVFRTKFAGQEGVAMRGADALEYVLRDRDKNFSSEQGWQFSLGRLFTRGLMLLDFDEHLFHRRIMNVAFKRDALRDYMTRMDVAVIRGIRPWGAAQDFRFYPAIKQLALDIAAVAFLGLELGAEAAQVMRAFNDTVAASLSVVRLPIPGLSYWKGLAGREVLSEFFAAKIPERRGSDQGDMFTRLCNATSEDGESFSDQDIVDHMIFMMMAAHDTVTSTLTTSAYMLAAHPAWQTRLRDEVRGAGSAALDYDDLANLEQTDWVFNEAMRMWPPVPYIPRTALRAFEWQGHRIPAHAQVSVSPDSAHRDAAFWTAPERFDPERFSPERAEHKRHSYAFAPFGGGAPKCIGMYFALALSKVFLHRFLLAYELRLHPGYAYRMQQVPIPKPRDGLRLVLTAARG